MDFYSIEEKYVYSGRGRNKELESIDVVPDFDTEGTKDLMVRGGKFYAVWNAEKGMWSQNERDVRWIVDLDLYKHRDELQSKYPDKKISVKTMKNFSTNSWMTYRKFVSSLPDNYIPLDSKLTFVDTNVKREDYVSKRLDYALEEGDYSAWDRLIGRLYDPLERQKLEWAIGAVVSGDSRDIQKFIVLYGSGGTGKSTVIDIICKLFDGYHVTINAKAIGSNGNRFALDPLRHNPLVAVEPDSKLDQIADNTRLNSVISHEVVMIEEKGKTAYPMRANCFLFLGSNSPVKITEGRSGLIRRLIDVNPTGKLFPPREYDTLMAQIDFQLGAIAKHCLDVYRELGKHYYKNYRPQQMISKTNVFYNFVEEKQDELSVPEGISLARAHAIYKKYCEDALIDHPMPRHIFKDELEVYFEECKPRGRVNGEQVRSLFVGFKSEMLEPPVLKKEEKPLPMVLDEVDSPFDILLADCKAQYAVERDGELMPKGNWRSCKTTLKDLDTTKPHYIHGGALTKMGIVTIDFDLKDESGKKSMLLNLEAASKWPKTYAEFSQGGNGIHLEYYYKGDLDELDSLYAPGIEVKVFRGDAALRRRLSKCNNLPLATLPVGSLPVKEKKMLDVKELQDELHLRNIINKSLRKEFHGFTKPEILWIEHILEEAYASGMHYDVEDMYKDIRNFALKSHNNADYCYKVVQRMHFHSKDVDEQQKYVAEAPRLNRQDEARRLEGDETKSGGNDIPIVFFDCEVFPNLFLINWKFEGEGQPVQRMINPTPGEVEALFKYRLVGFNCRKYDNHMLYARYLGKSTQELYDLSRRIIVEGAREAFYPEAYDISYTDIYDYTKTKQSLKKWEIQLQREHNERVNMIRKSMADGMTIEQIAEKIHVHPDLIKLWLDPGYDSKIHHKELGLPWDKPVPEERWTEVAEYCDNDVNATEAVWNATQPDFTAREILADVAGLTVNDTTNSLTTRIIFGKDRHPQGEFNYRFMGDLTDASDIYDSVIEELGLDPEYTKFDSKGRPLFPGYTYSFGKSVYRGEEVGEGGYVYATTGIFTDVPVVDVASMHPSSIVDEQLFGERYTQRFQDILSARIAIKHKDYEAAAKLLDGKLAKYLTDKGSAKALSGALKIAINSVYGLTAARFPNPFRDDRNIDNIVAKRGALFMVNLKHEVQRRGFTVVHIKTDSIKIANATPEIIDFCVKYAKLYGYNFEHESTYDRICLVNDAVYIARYADKAKCERLYGYIPEKNGDGEQYVDGVRIHEGWTATGAQFQQPYVFKTLFSGEPLTFDDRCETKSVTSSIYLDMNEGYPDVSAWEEELERRLWNEDHPDKKPRKLNGDWTSMHDDDIRAEIAKGHNYQFIGRTGLFYPIQPGRHGGTMYREKDGKYFAVGGTKGYRWLEAETVQQLGLQGDLDPRYHDQLASDAIGTISQFGDFETFVGDNDSPYSLKEEPLLVPCGDGKYNTCFDCPNCVNDRCRKGYSLASYIDH